MAFLAGMKPHHEQAVEMSDIVLAADPTAEVAAIAEQIKDAQAPEIKQIETMLADLGADASTGHGGGHAEHGGMTSEADMAVLEAAEGEQAARLYLEAMIKHHEGAIGAADAQVEDGEYEPARQLATSIAKEQAAEIDRMKALLAAL